MDSNYDCSYTSRYISHVVDTNGDGNSEHVYVFRAEGCRLFAETVDADDNGQMEYSVSYYKNGQVSNESFYNNDTGDKLLSSTYDRDGLLMRSEYYNYNNDGTLESVSTEYHNGYAPRENKEDPDTQDVYLTSVDTSIENE